MALHFPPMPTAPVIVVDTLNSLIEAELNSIFRFVGPGSPYLTRATAKLRTQLHEIAFRHEAHASRLAGMVDSLGGTPPPPGIQPEEQYLAFLSLKFLLPKLVDAKKLIIQRYDSALAILKDTEPPAGVVELMTTLRTDHTSQLATLDAAMTEVLTAKV